MATIHRTTMVPTKLELLGEWLPGRPWYRGTGRPPALARAGGFRLDDPAGEIGIEFVFVTDAEETTYHVPLAYRGAPLPGAEAGLVGTSEHGVLGRRWIYDAAHDPVAVTQLLRFIGGATEAQHQNDSDTPEPAVGRSWSGGGRPAAPTPLRVSDSASGWTTVALELTDDVQRSLDVVRVLRPTPTPEADGTVLGSVEAEWRRLDGAIARGRVAVVR